MEYKSLGDYFYYTEPIGQGSFSLIYRGYRLKDKKLIAIKKFTKFIEKKYIDSEINLMKNLNNSNILKLYEVIKTKTNLYLVLEYCEQGDLTKYINSKNNNYDSIYIYQLILALKYLYHKNILHRDIKPQNILIHNNVIKICDFGFATDLKNNDLLNTFCGSPLYMAPEILKLGEYTDKSDIWSLGIIIYEILFKEHPYPCKNQQDLINTIKNTSNLIINVEWIDEDLKYIIEKMLDKNPYTRINWKNIFNSKWILKFDKKKLEYIINNDYISEENEFISKEDTNNDYILEENEFISKEHTNNDEIDNMIFRFDEDINTAELYTNNSFEENYTKHQNIYNSLNLEKNINHIDLQTKSLKLDKNIKFNEYDGTKVYSRSAPNNNCSSIIYENYICNQLNSKNENDIGYKIIGLSPNINSSGNWFYSLNRSVNTIKNFFNFT